MCDYKFHTLPHPTIFLTARERSKESLSVPAAMHENFEHISPLCSLETLQYRVSQKKLYVFKSLFFDIM